MTSSAIDTPLTPQRKFPTPTPRAYRMPAEWEPHWATWLVWPHNRSDWNGKMAAIDWSFAEIVRYLAADERVAILFRNSGDQRRAERVLARVGVDARSIQTHLARTNRSWIRDAGPIFVVRRDLDRPETAVTDWRFNGWARYRTWQDDDALPARIAEYRGLRRFVVRHGREKRRVVLEGGSIDVDGQGLLLATESCLLSSVQARNPGLTKADYEAVFAEYLGVRRVLWLGEGIVGDDTHGHVDTVARFVAPATVVVATEADRHDANYAALRDNLARLRAMRDLAGRPLTLLQLPMPRGLYFDGRRLPASYLNFYIGNRYVLVPSFNDPNDRRALERLSRVFAGRTVVGIHAVDLVLGLGTVHCLTQQEPC